MKPMSNVVQCPRCKRLLRVEWGKANEKDALSVERDQQGNRLWPKHFPTKGMNSKHDTVCAQTGSVMEPEPQ